MSLKHAPVKVGSAVVGAMDCVLIAIEGVTISEQFKKKKLYNDPYLVLEILMKLFTGEVEGQVS